MNTHYVSEKHHSLEHSTNLPVACKRDEHPAGGPDMSRFIPSPGGVCVLLCVLMRRELRL
jgi:hypothetical protein